MTYGPPPTHGQQPPQPRNGDGAYPQNPQPHNMQPQSGWTPAPPQQQNQQNRSAQPTLHGPEESYADPPRTWKRAGSLLGSWAVVWASILIAGLVFEGLIDRTRESAWDEEAEHPNQTAWRVMQFSVGGELERADGLLCSDFDHMTPDELQTEVSQWEGDADSLVNTTVGFADENESQGSEAGTYLMEIELEAGDRFETWYYDVTVQEDGGSYCVAEIAKNTTVE